MRNASTWWIIAAIMLLLDLYVYQALRTVTQHSGERTRMAVQVTYWIVSGLTLAALLSFPYIMAIQNSVIFRNYVFALVVGLFLAKLVGSVFFLADDLRRALSWITIKLFLTPAKPAAGSSNSIPRSVTIL